MLFKKQLLNGTRILKAFKDLKLEIEGIQASDFTGEQVFTFGMEPDAVDILTYSKGVTVDAIFKNAKLIKIDDHRSDEKNLIDQQDILALRRILKSKNK